MSIEQIPDGDFIENNGDVISAEAGVNAPNYYPKEEMPHEVSATDDVEPVAAAHEPEVEPRLFDPEEPVPMPDSLKAVKDRLRPSAPYQDPAKKGGTAIFFANRNRK